jgi:CRISPR/Cas system-associated exonuclease Cas4 (RecB family)
MTERTWSYSSMSTYETCPLKYKLNKIDGVESPPGRAAQRGLNVHERLERYLNHEIDDIPDIAARFFEDEIVRLREEEARAEVELAFDRRWKLSPWDSAWVRAKLDAIVPSKRIVVDFKTGRYYEGHRDQAHLYGLLCLKADLAQSDVLVEFWYLDNDQVMSWEFKRGYLENMERKWELKYGKLEAEEDWQPRPGKHCRWCSYASNVGGLCAFNSNGEV